MTSPDSIYSLNALSPLYNKVPSSEIETEVTKAFVEQLSLLTLEKVNVTNDQYTNVLTIEVVYALPNDEVVSTVIGLVLVQGTKPIYEELL
jgi:hypothetical protein